MAKQSSCCLWNLYFLLKKDWLSPQLLLVPSLFLCLLKFTFIWVNYNDLTATSLESWLIREIIPKWPYFRLVKYCNLPRFMPHIVDQSPTFAGNISAAEHLISLDELLDCWLVEFSIQTLSWAVPVWWTILNARTAQLGLAAYEEAPWWIADENDPQLVAKSGTSNYWINMDKPSTGWCRINHPLYLSHRKMLIEWE